MAKLELPVRTFVEDFVRRAFPSYDWGRGSAINDLVIKPMAVLLQPLRHEIDVIKIGQSINNYQFMRRDDLDLLAANWGKFRQRGSKSIGFVRVYFDTAADYRFTYLEFFALDGTTFILTTPVSISATDLIARRRMDNTFYYDVEVQSIGVGNRYALPAGSIVGIRNAPPGIVRVENVEDFRVTAPDESNYDVVNTMFKSLGMRNLVSRASLRAPLLDNFAGILDLFITGSDHSKMLRDLKTVEISGNSVTLHLGGMSDIWLNTTALVQRKVTISYLPALGKFRLVSDSQAQNNELIYAFPQSLVSIEGRFSAPDYNLEDLDESVGIFFDIAGLPTKTFVLEQKFEGMYQLGIQDLIAGLDLVALPTLNNGGNAEGEGEMQTMYLTDLLGVNFANTPVQVGDLILVADATLEDSSVQNRLYKFRKIMAKSGRVLKVGPPSISTGSMVFDNLNNSINIGIGGRFIPYPTNYSYAASVNDLALIPSNSCAGYYRILATTNTGFYLGNVISQGLLTYISHATVDTDELYTYRYTSPLPPSVDSSCWIYRGVDGAYNQDVAKWFKIKSIERSGSYTTITTVNGFTSNEQISVVQCLRNSLPNMTPIYFERPADAAFGRSMREVFGSQAMPAAANTGHTLYVSVSDKVPAGQTTFNGVGLGVVASVGDLLVFEGGFIKDEHKSITGGDGSKFTVVIDSVDSEDSVTFRPILPFDIPANTRYALMRNHKHVGEAEVTEVNTTENTITLDAWPLGLGDGTGMILRREDSGGILQYVVTRGTAGKIRELKFNPPVKAITLTMSSTGYVTLGLDDIGSTVTQEVNGDVFAGVLERFDNATREWTIVPNDPTADLFQVSAVSPVLVEDSPATGFPTSASQLVDSKYFNPDEADKGRLVRQGTYVGVLDSVSSDGSYVWTIKPLSDNDLFDITDEEVPTFVDYGTGVPAETKGWGTLREPATNPVINRGDVVLTLDESPTALNVGDQIKIFSRFGLGGGYFNGKTFKVLNDTDWHTAPFSEVRDADLLCPLLGNNFDTYDVVKRNEFSLEVLSFQDPEFVRIVNAPGLQPFPTEQGTLNARDTIVAINDSNMGMWAQHGRILILSTTDAKYYLAINGPAGEHSLELLDPIPVTIYPPVEYEIVEGFNTPYFTIEEEHFMPYRIIRPPELGDVIFTGRAGNVNAGAPVFFDSTVNFASVLQGADFDAEDYQLFIDSGPDASTLPVLITDISSSMTLVTNKTFSATSTDIQYHIVRRNYARNREFWHEGIIVDGTNIELTDVDTDWDFARNNTYYEWEFVVQPHPTNSTIDSKYTWAVPQLTGTYNKGTRTLTVNDAVGTVRSTDLGIFSVPGGFPEELFGQKCRVLMRLTDRASVHYLGGSALNTFNYYLRDFFTLPVVRINSVQQLNPQSMQPVKDLNYRLVVNDSGLRYSSQENNSIEILAPDLEEALLQPIQVDYTSDLSIDAANQYLNAEDVRVLNSNQLAKRMETVSIDISILVRSELSEAALIEKVSLFVNTSKSTEPLSKDKLIRYLYQNNAVSYIDVSSLKLSGQYDQCDGEVITYSDVNEIFGADTACYLARSISVARLAEQVS